MSFTTWTPAGATTLNGSMSSTQLTSVLTSATSVIGALRPAPGVEVAIAVEDEIMIVTGVTSNTVTVTRGAYGTTAATHANAKAVYALSLAGLYQLIKAATLLTAPGS